MISLIYFILFFIGLIIIIKGSDIFVDNSVKIAETFNISKLVIGATLVSIGTVLPETFVSVISSYKGISDMAFRKCYRFNCF